MGQVLKDQAQGNPELWKTRTFNQVCLLHKTFSDSNISNSKKRDVKFSISALANLRSYSVFILHFANILEILILFID